jgi:hypothetical protein
MVRRLEDLTEELTRLVEALEPGTFPGEEAARLVSMFTRLEQIAAAGKTLMARRVDESNVWRTGTDRTAAGYLARHTGMSTGDTRTMLVTARALDDLPETAHAFRSGRLSVDQAHAVMTAATADPSAEAELLELAANEDLGTLNRRANQVRAAAETDEAARYDRLHRHRRLRTWTDVDGASCGAWRLPPDAGAEVLAALAPLQRDLHRRARRQGRPDSWEACGADALRALARDRLNASDPPDPAGATSNRPRAEIQVRVDHAALLRGHTVQGEVCEIPGVGPIPVAVARSYAEDSVLTLLVTRGTDVTAVARQDRYLPPALRAALRERDPECVVPGCHERDRLEIDHVVPLAAGGPTSAANLARLCAWHHHLKTFQGYRLSGSPGAWEWSAPDDETSHLLC